MQAVIQLIVLISLLTIVSCQDNTGHRIVFHPPGVDGKVLGDVEFNFLISAPNGNKPLDERVKNAVLHYAIGTSNFRDEKSKKISLTDKGLEMKFEIKSSDIEAISGIGSGDFEYYLTYTMDGHDELLASKEYPKSLFWSAR